MGGEGVRGAEEGEEASVNVPPPNPTTLSTSPALTARDFFAAVDTYRAKARAAERAHLLGPPAALKVEPLTLVRFRTEPVPGATMAILWSIA